jgi:hypothetical protein
MMKKHFIIFVAIVIMAGFLNKVNAQAIENTAAGAVIITPISITETAALHFGVMSVLTGTAGTCVLSTTGSRSATGGVNLSASTPTATNAAYTVAGQANTTYAITLPGSITVTKAVTLETMTIGSLLARTASAAADGLTGTLNGSGGDSFTVGGTLSVAAAQTTGTYTGTFDVTVAYN